MSNAQVASIYARAVLELADERAKRAAVIASARDLSEALTNEVIVLLDDPRLGKDAAKAALRGLLTGKAESEVIELLLLLIDRNRLIDAPKVLKQIVHCAARDAGEVTVQLTTAAPLGEAALAGLTQTLRGMLGAGARITTAVDPALIGGMTLRVDDLYVDGSVQRQLSEMKNRILTIPLSNALWDA